MGDLIYRQDALRTDCFGDGHEGLRAFHSYHDYRLMREYLESLPSAEPKRKRGKWIVDEKRFGNTDRHCNLCGAILEGDDWKWRNNYYCYHCGAPMNLKGD